MSFVALCQHPPSWPAACDPGLIPRAVEKFLRYVIISGAGSSRGADHPGKKCASAAVHDPGGRNRPALVHTANRDLAAFEHPDRFDVGRAPKTTWGRRWRPSLPPARSSARMELQEAFRGLLTRLPACG